MTPLSRFLSEVLAQGSDPVPMIPEVKPPEYRGAPVFPCGKPWVLSEEDWELFAQQGYPEDFGL